MSSNSQLDLFEGVMVPENDMFHKILMLKQEHESLRRMTSVRYGQQEYKLNELTDLMKKLIEVLKS